MDLGGNPNQQHNYTTRAHRSGIVIRDPTQTTNTQPDVTDPNNLPQESFKRDADQYMSIASVTRIMRRVLPAHAKITDDAKETMKECVSEFIRFITSESNQRCHGECRKTISSEDIISAMGALGFDDYMEPLNLFLSKYRSQDPNHIMLHPLTSARRNARLVREPEAHVAQPPPSIMSHTSALLGSSIVGGSNYVELPQTNDYDMANQNGGEGSSNNLDFDPFGQFK
ncbi:hypothetical protein BUALT_Bualt07G0097800 [Buddleja alternifolia]|uniref:Transcription factor CBF/NF-Y/archaeal histone domain-containing protein n=1 Tax=Buddleja alternifolia TaxID=168488 RepID=A0AAV6XGH5_9LAMI|nr:hypothetical protein BUALT_Bualt07G0097800 [Buddleja alternifolia]